MRFLGIQMSKPNKLSVMSYESLPQVNSKYCIVPDNALMESQADWLCCSHLWSNKLTVHAVMLREPAVICELIEFLVSNVDYNVSSLTFFMID